MHRGANGQLRLLDLQPKGVKVSKHWGLPQRDCFFAGEMRETDENLLQNDVRNFRIQWICRPFMAFFGVCFPRYFVWDGDNDKPSVQGDCAAESRPFVPSY